MAECSVATEEIGCPFDCAASDRPVLIGRDRMHGLPGTFQVVECLGCGLLRTNPRPTPDGMDFYYGPDYLPYRSSRPRARKGATLTDRLLLTQAVPRLPPGRLLEVGCGSGAFLDLMAQRGWRVTGIERSAAAAAACAGRGFPTHAGRLETAPEPAEKVDMVAAWMVVEHLHDPVGGLARLRSWTRPGGWLVASVPDAGCAQRRWFGGAWFPLQLPNHLFHFTAATLGRLLQRTGWAVRRIVHQPNLGDLVASLGYQLEDRGRFATVAQRLATYPWWGGRLNLALLPMAYPLSLLGQTARITVWAQAAP
jgi:2-polyprenyl-3-methyl-5-hydroxy-6-metoxy-1,4-benzoquinol methylase